MLIKRVSSGFCNVLNKHLVVAGTAWHNQENKVERYDIEKYSWEMLPDLN